MENYITGEDEARRSHKGKKVTRLKVKRTKESKPGQECRDGK